ncbi:MAG: YdaU family protein [Deltaproteobacteria bacterium]|nr:YdaU family protein [Deltaproteobacteria bacterium]
MGSDVKSDYFNFYPADFLSDENVVVMNNREIGCYIKLLCFHWREGSIPSDSNRLARLCGESSEEFSEIWINLAPCFKERKGRLYNKRLSAEASRLENHIEKRKAAGRAGAQARWQEDCDRNANAMRFNGNINLTKPNLEFNLNNDSTDSAGRHFSNLISLGILGNIEETAKSIEEIQKKKPKKKPFNPFQWIQSKVNKKSHPEAIESSLVALLNGWDRARDPWKYVERIFKSENQNLDERDAGIETAELKKEISKFWESAGDILLKSSEKKSEDESVRDRKAELAEQLKKIGNGGKL